MTSRPSARPIALSPAALQISRSLRIGQAPPRQPHQPGHRPNPTGDQASTYPLLSTLLPTKPLRQRLTGRPQASPPLHKHPTFPPPLQLTMLTHGHCHPPRPALRSALLPLLRAPHHIKIHFQNRPGLSSAATPTLSI